MSGCQAGFNQVHNTTPKKQTISYLKKAKTNNQNSIIALKQTKLYKQNKIKHTKTK